MFVEASKIRQAQEGIETETAIADSLELPASRVIILMIRMPCCRAEVQRSWQPLEIRYHSIPGRMHIKRTPFKKRSQLPKQSFPEITTFSPKPD